MKVTNAELRSEIYKSKLSYCDLTRAEQRAMPLPDLHVDSLDDVPAGFTGLIKFSHRAYLPADFVAPFPPFQMIRDGQVIASAFLDKTGATSIHGKLTDALGVLIYTLVSNYSRKPNWSGYSYVDEMIAFALAEAIVPVLRIDERKGSNPFAFLTTNTYFSFCKVWRKENAIAKHRQTAVETSHGECQWSKWNAEQNGIDTDWTAIYDELCAELDLLMRDELIRRDSAVQIPRKRKHQLKMTPVLATAIRYGFKIGLPGAAMATHFGLEAATVSRVKNDIDRTRMSKTK